MARPFRTEIPHQLDTIGRRIRFARITAGLTQAALARAVAHMTRTRCGPATVSKWETDGVQNPNNATMLALQAITGFSLPWLVSGKGPRRVELPTPNELRALDPKLLSRALAAAAPDVQLDFDRTAQLASKLYGVLSDTPEVSPEVLARFAVALRSE